MRLAILFLITESPVLKKRMNYPGSSHHMILQGKSL